MRKTMLAAFVLIPACTHTTVDVGVDGGKPTAPEAGSSGDRPAGDLRVAGSDPACPLTPPDADSVCNVSEWQSCAYRWTAGTSQAYAGCTCFEESPSVKRWDCQGAVTADECPAQQPPAATACIGNPTSQCHYPPHLVCGCNFPDAGGTWACGDLGSVPGQATAGPASVPENKAVKDLTDVEAQAWCAWLLNINGPRPNPIEGPISTDGYAVNLGSTVNPHFYAGVCMPGTIPVSYCAANLKLSPCEATVAEMNDCALTMARDLPSPHGCGRLKERAYCEDTIFHRIQADQDAGVPCDAVKVR